MIPIVVDVRVRFALPLVVLLNFRLLFFRCIIHVARYVIIAVLWSGRRWIVVQRLHRRF